MISALYLAALVAVPAATVPSPADSTPAPWATLTIGDVSAFCTDIRGVHPGMVDPLSPAFATQVDRACDVAAERSRHAASFLDWMDTMQSLVTSFRDGHTGIRFNVVPAQLRWPGFLIDGQGGRWIVRRPATALAATGDPPDGAELVACDGQPAAQFLENQVDQKTVDWSKEPERIRQAFRAFTTYHIDGPPPAKQCRFRTNGKIIDVTLDWEPISTIAMQPLLAPFLRRGAALRPLAVTFAPDHHVWVQLGNFQDETALKALEARLLARQSLLRSARYVVLDLRGNGGGNSTWGGRYASILWGKDAVDGRRLADQSSNPADYGKFWRRSKAAADKMHAAADEYASEGTDYADLAQFWRALGDTVAAAGSDGLYQDECCRPKPRPSVVPRLAYTGKVFVLTDAGCFSSCVVVMNTFKRMGAVQIGEASGQNEVYGESVGPFNLPSGLGWYRIPVSIIRQPRSSLGGLPPDIAWAGAMDDDAGLHAWVGKLARSTATGDVRRSSP